MTARPGHPPREATPETLVREAVRLLQEALDSPAPRLAEPTDTAENMVARLRDQLIDDLRREPDSSRAPRRRAALEQVNVALSDIVGVEYPVAGYQRGLLEEARDVLSALLEQGIEGGE